jgi:pterin-4a-carbinolamine dehydratase
MSQEIDPEDLTPNELGLNKSHQLLLHILWAKKTITLPELEAAHKKILQKYKVPGSPNLDTYVKAINDALKPLSFAIYKDKFDGAGIVYSIVNTKKDEIMSAEINRLELEIYNVLFDTFKNKDAAMAVHDAANTIKHNPKIKKDYAKATVGDIESSIQSLVEQEFLTQVGQNISLGNRSRLELRNYFEG